MSEAASPDEFLDRALAALDWSSLTPWVEAVEARVGVPVPIALCKMTLLERWFQLSSAELDDACHARPAFRRFLCAPLHGPVAEVWMHRQFSSKLAAANTELGKFISAVELMLADRRIAPPTCAWTHPDATVLVPPNEGTRTTVFEPGRLAALAAQAESAANASGPQIDLAPGSAPLTRAAALLLWPWTGATRVESTLRIGRDPEFSSLARQLWADPRISRRHAELTPAEQGIIVRDLGSSNGSYVDEIRLPPGRALLLRSDARLRFGPSLNVKLVFFPVEATPAS